MPHLDIFGLSEMFCLSDAGNNHWDLIAKYTDRQPSQWKGEQGERIYASFLYAAVNYYRHLSVDEDDVLRVECVPLGLRAPFFLTETRYIKGDGDVVATVRLMSTFSATTGGSNNKFLRSTIAFNTEPFGIDLIEATRDRCRSFYRHDDTGLIKKQSHLVNPSVDFNAAHFMYFVNFSKLFKSYECPELSATVPLKSREIAYFGNVDPFETITIHARQKNMNVMSSMRRESDQKCIARSLSINFDDQPDMSQFPHSLQEAAKELGGLSLTP